MYDVLIVHQNFPGQFANLGEALSERGTVVGLGAGEREDARLGRVRYRSHSQKLPVLSPRGAEHDQVESEVRVGRAVERSLRDLKASGFSPDLVIAHPGWGEVLFLRDVYPGAAFIAYLEYYYRGANSDVDFDPEFPPPPHMLRNIRLRNLPSAMAFQDADLSVSATAWQTGTFPQPMRSQLRTIHDGIEHGARHPERGRRL